VFNTGGAQVTRLRNDDIKMISSRLARYDQELQIKTGRTLLGIACHGYGVSETEIREKAKSFYCEVIPITAGQGIIGDFSATVCAILQFLGFPTKVPKQSDTSGIALAFEEKANAIFMADDNRFVGINLRTGSVADNSEATGRVYSAALDLIAGGLKDRDVLVLGCGSVGAAAARGLLSFGAKVALHDQFYPAASSLHKKLPGKQEIVIETQLSRGIGNYRYIVDATPADRIIPDNQITEDIFLAAPGVPLGISDKGCKLLNNRLIHDKLELGVAAMAVSLLC
jgi:pyrrolysine biosynthesis protein PylD